MAVTALCLSPSRSAPARVVEALEVVEGAGIVGDRYFGREQRHPGQNLTLIEAEEVEAFNARVGRSLAVTDPRRNVITRGVRLNDLVGKVFAIGTTTLRGVELCEPCGTLAGYLAGSNMLKKDFVREFTHRCGLRADVVTSGSIRIGDPVVLVSDELRPEKSLERSREP
jgi:MOSC domain-containing protein YiiM